MKKFFFELHSRRSYKYTGFRIRQVGVYGVVSFPFFFFFFKVRTHVPGRYSTVVVRRYKSVLQNQKN